MRIDQEKIAKSFEELASIGKNYFRNLYKAPVETTIA